jgi:flagellar motor switch protein FliN/FliY
MTGSNAPETAEPLDAVGTDVTAPSQAPQAPLASMAGVPSSGTSGTPHPPGPPILGRIERLNDVAMVLTVELGRASMVVKDLLGLRAGSVVELNRPVGSPVDLLVNGTLVGRGEVVVIDEEFGVRITELVGADEPDE